MKLIKKIIQSSLNQLGKATGTQITLKVKPRLRINLHPDAVSDGRGMERYVDLTRKFCRFIPENVFEIGANYGQDAEYLRKAFGLSSKDIYIFEPHPKIFDEVKNLYGFNCFDLAISNTDGEMIFNAINVSDNEYNNSGISSLKKGLTTNADNFTSVKVNVVRMDGFIKRNKIEAIDFLKIDVEGCNLEVLQGFGDELHKVKVIQTESENITYWEDQKLFSDMFFLLNANGFELVDFVLTWDGVQSDSFWVRKDCLVRAGKK